MGKETKLRKSILDSLNQSKNMLSRFIENEDNLVAIERAAVTLIETLTSGNTIYSCGNGGSMSDAMHFAEELSGRYRNNRKGLSAIAISDPGHLSCVANDFGYEYVFSRFLEANAKPGDCLLGISTSGSSENIFKAAQFANENRMKVVSLTGLGGSKIGVLSDVDISVGYGGFADRTQELHIKVIHNLIELVERHFFPENYQATRNG